MNNRTTIIWTFAILAFYGCKNSQKAEDSFQIIDIESNMDKMETISLSQFTYDIRYIPLETNEDFPVTWIGDCDFSGNLIILTDMKKCLLYDTNGRFILSIGSQGRGPGEFQFCSNVSFDKNNNIYMQDLFDLVEYNLDGFFIKKYKNTFRANDDAERYFRSWLIIDNTLFFGHVPNGTGQIENKALILNKHGDIKQSYKNYILFKRDKPVASGFEDYAHVYQFKNTIFYKEFYNDTLFSMDDQYQLSPRYVFDRGKFKLPTSERAKTPIGDLMDQYLFIWDAFQTDKYLFINCQFGKNFPAKRLTPKTIMGLITTEYNTTRVLGIYNIQTEEFSFCKPTSTDNPLFTSGLYNDIDAGPRFFPTKQVNDSTLIMWVKADELKSHIESDDFKNSVPKYPEKKKQLENLTNNLSLLDNPVLMIVTFNK